jgi:serine/threonine protein phosphatase 1
LSGRRIVIGDIHGAAKALEQVLQNVNKEDQLFFIGDYVDGWPESKEVIDIILSLPNTVCIEGNHDVWCREWINYGLGRQEWREQGGLATIESLFPVVGEKKYRDFFNSLHPYWITEDNIVFVHGGYYNLGRDDYFRYHWDRSLFYDALTAYKSGDRSFGRLAPYKKVFIGHTSTMGEGTDQPIHVFNLVNVDTGAGWAGRLTAYDVDSGEYWQSDLTKDLYA